MSATLPVTNSTDDSAEKRTGAASAPSTSNPSTAVSSTPGSRKPALQLDPRTYARALSCVHCGLCLPACPTYTENGNEADSPRGRIQLMRGLAEGTIGPTASVIKHLDLCLDCRACETACPSGVVYHELIEETRTRLAEKHAKSPTGFDLRSRVMRWIFFHVFTRDKRLKLALLPARLMQKTGLYGLLRKSGAMKLLPAQFRKMEQMLPPTGDLWPKRLPERVIFSESGFQPVFNALAGEMGAHMPSTSGAASKPRVVVGFFPGCIGSVMFEKVNRQAVELLAACGAEVIVPRAQGCCGAIHHHNGAHHPAELLAKNNIDAFLPKDGPAAQFIATNIAGCGAMLREYDFLLRDDPEYRDRARDFSSRVRDISEVLLELGLPPMKFPITETITYHDACHLAHAQKITAQPRQLLASIPGLRLVPLPESDMCCGAAGTYNLEHPEMATQLARRKLRHIASTGAEICATGNVGCAMQISSEAEAIDQPLRVVHPVELLHYAVFGRG